MIRRDLQRDVRELVEPAVRDVGYDLVAVEWVGGQRRPILRLSIDKPGGIGADDCTKVTHRVSPLLDEADPVPTAYDLEVSSPGIERPVQRLEDFRRFAGYRLRLRLEEGLPRRRYTGTLVRVTDAEIGVLVDGAEHTIALESVDSAHLLLDLEAYNELASGLPDLPPPGDVVVPNGSNPSPTTAEEST